LQSPQSISAVVLVQGIDPLQGIYLQKITETQGKILINPGLDGTGIRDPNSSGKTSYMPYIVEPLRLLQFSQEKILTPNIRHDA
jgi:hypothetical protein